MNFDIYEQRAANKDGVQPDAVPVRKRILKAQYKSVKFQANSYLSESRSKTQSSDYYVGVWDSKHDKCYLVPVTAAYQMGQRIAGFQENFGAKQEIDPAVKAMTYYD